MYATYYTIWRKHNLIHIYILLHTYMHHSRLTLTLDPTISRSQITESHLKVKEEGLTRRRTRRINRRLSTITPGDTVEGVIKKVINEGVLVTLTSLGPLNITGLLPKRDLPKQFQVPPDLKDSFQTQVSILL